MRIAWRVMNFAVGSLALLAPLGTAAAVRPARA